MRPHPKLLTLLALAVLAPLLAGLYGAANDQLTYTLSPEYYTRFKFYQFGLAHQRRAPQSTQAQGAGERREPRGAREALLPHPRVAAAWVGFLSTWWMGSLLGGVLALVGLIHASPRRMFWVTLQAFGVAILVAFACGLAGLACGWWVLAETGVDWWLPASLRDARAFIAVGSMHNFSYLGGVPGLLAAIGYSVWKRRQHR